MMNRRQFVAAATAGASASASAQSDQRSRWLAIAESHRPQLKETLHTRTARVRPVADESAFLRSRMDRARVSDKPLRRGDSFILDFGRHMAGYFSCFVEGEGVAVDAPVRLYDEPKPLCGRQFIMDYAVLFGSTVLDYVRATGDNATARELWPVVRRQQELVGSS